MHGNRRSPGVSDGTGSVTNKSKPRLKGPWLNSTFGLDSAQTLPAHGVTEFATINVRDFQGLGFRRVWSPLTN